MTEKIGTNVKIVMSETTDTPGKIDTIGKIAMIDRPVIITMIEVLEIMIGIEIEVMIDIVKIGTTTTTMAIEEILLPGNDTSSDPLKGMAYSGDVCLIKFIDMRGTMIVEIMSVGLLSRLRKPRRPVTISLSYGVIQVKWLTLSKNRILSDTAKQPPIPSSSPWPEQRNGYQPYRGAPPSTPPVTPQRLIPQQKPAYVPTPPKPVFPPKENKPITKKTETPPVPRAPNHEEIKMRLRNRKKRPQNLWSGTLSFDRPGTDTLFASYSHNQ